MTHYETWSGETWYLSSDHTSGHRTIQVIESPAQVSPKGKSEGCKPKKVPFGFSRALPEKPKRK